MLFSDVREHDGGCDASSYSAAEARVYDGGGGVVAVTERIRMSCAADCVVGIKKSDYRIFRVYLKKLFFCALYGVENSKKNSLLFK